jgi:hypothetical protein
MSLHEVMVRNIQIYLVLVPHLFLGKTPRFSGQPPISFPECEVVAFHKSNIDVVAYRRFLQEFLDFLLSPEYDLGPYLDNPPFLSILYNLGIL